MSNHGVYKSLNGTLPNCNGVCKTKDGCCAYYYIDEVCSLLNQWKKEAHVEEPLLIKYDYKKKKMLIYTTKAGLLVGFNGETIDKYEKLLNEKLMLRFTTADGIPQDSNFIELVECNDVVI